MKLTFSTICTILIALMTVTFAGGEQKPDAMEGQDVKIVIKKVEPTGKISVIYEGHDYLVTLAGVKPASTIDNLVKAESDFLAGNEREFILRLDSRNGTNVTGQIYSYGHMERDQGRQKEIMSAVKKGEASTKLRWFGMNLNIHLIESGEALYDDGSATNSEALFLQLAKSAAK